MIASELEDIPGTEPERRRTYPYYTTTELEAKTYITREDIRELGFLRSHGDRAIFAHMHHPELLLMVVVGNNYGVKDLAEERIQVWKNAPESILLYDSAKPNKADIQLVIDNYAA